MEQSCKLAEKSAFDSDVFQTVLLIQLARIYDALIAGLPEKQAKALLDMHEHGEFMCPHPAIAIAPEDGQAQQ